MIGIVMVERFGIGEHIRINELSGELAVRS